MEKSKNSRQIGRKELVLLGMEGRMEKDFSTSSLEISRRKEILNPFYSIGRGSQSVRHSSDTFCMICGAILIENYCTVNVCQKCCSEGRCPFKNDCQAIKILLPKRNYNPSRRNQNGN